MVGQDETLRGNEGATSTSSESGGGLLDVFEPLVGQFKVVLLLDLLLRGNIKEPHALVSTEGRKCDEDDQKRENRLTFHRSQVTGNRSHKYKRP